MAERGATPQVPTLGRRALALAQSFTSPLLPDDYIELINPLWSTRELRGRVERVDAETDEAVTITIKPGLGMAGSPRRASTSGSGWRSTGASTGAPTRSPPTPRVRTAASRSPPSSSTRAPSRPFLCGRLRARGDRPPGRRRRHVRAARAAALAAAAHQRRQRRDADREHAPQPRRRARAARHRAHPLRALPADRDLRRGAPRARGAAARVPADLAPQRRRRAHPRRGARRSSAPTGASARRSCAAPPGCCRR